MNGKQSYPVKITQPAVGNILLRSRLFEKLDRFQDEKIVWIEGPAGSGKTTLVSSYVAERQLSCIWYRIDAGDEDLATFFYYLGLAGKKAAPRRRKALPLFTMEFLQGVPEFSRTFFDELLTRFTAQGLLVFDNMHEVSPDTLLHEAVIAGINRLPDNFRVIMVSRAMLPEAYSRLHANRQLQKCTWDDLQLSPGESEAIIRMRMDGKLPGHYIDRIYELTQGWTAGLQLLIEHAKQTDVKEAFSTDRVPDDIFNYFAGEIYTHLDGSIRGFLLRTALLPWMTTKSARTISGSTNVSACLNYLTSHNLFIELRDSTPKTYKYHPLFRGFLFRQARDELPSEEYHSLLLKGADVLFEEGYIESGADLLVMAGEWERMAGLIIEQAPTLAEQGRAGVIQRWLSTLPDRMVAEVPWLLFWQGVCCFPIQLAPGRSRIKEAYALFSRDKGGMGMLLCSLASLESCIIDINMAPLEYWLPEMQKNLSSMQGPLPPSIDERLTKAMLFGMLFNQPHNPGIKLWAKKAEQILLRDMHLRKNIELGSILLLYFKWTGNTSKARMLSALVKPSAVHADAHPKERLIFYTGEIAYLWSNCDFDEALDVLERAVKLSEDSGIKMLQPGLMCQGAFTLLGKNDPDSAEILLARLTPVLPVMNMFDKAEYYSIMSMISLHKGELNYALSLCSEALRIIVEGRIPYGEAMCSLGMGVILTAMQRYDEAGACLERARRIGSAMESLQIEYYYQLYAADLMFSAGRSKKAFEMLGKATVLGRENNFFDYGFFSRHAVSRLCIKALEADIETDHVRTFIRKNHFEPDPPPLALENWPWPVMIYTLGRFEIVLDGRTLETSGKAQKKPLEMLKALIAFGSRHVPVDRLIDMLWPDADGDTAQQSLRTTLHRLRKMIGSENIINYQDGLLSLDEQNFWVDARAFEHCVGLFESEGGSECNRDSHALCRKAIALYRGHFLYDNITDFQIISYREKLKSAFVRNAGKYGRYLEESSQWEAALECYQKALEIDDLTEEFYRRLMICNQKLGRRAEAVEVYNRCVKTLSAVLKIKPSPMTTALYKSLIS